MSATNTFFLPNTEYYSIFRNDRILNTKYYSGVRKSEYRIQIVVFGLQEILFWKFMKLFGQVFGLTIWIPKDYSESQKGDNILSHEHCDSMTDPAQRTKSVKIIKFSYSFFNVSIHFFSYFFFFLWYQGYFLTQRNT